jgi:hypothetical protein
MNIHVISAFIHWHIANIAKSFNPAEILDMGGTGKTRQFLACKVTDANLAQNIDATKLPFPDKSFDLALSIATLEHVNNWRAFLAESIRISRISTIHWFPVGTAAKEAEQIKERLGHAHPCTIPSQEDIEGILKSLNTHGTLSPLMTVGEHLLLLATINPLLNTPIIFDTVRRIGSEPYGMVLTITHPGDSHDTQ